MGYSLHRIGVAGLALALATGLIGAPSEGRAQAAARMSANEEIAKAYVQALTGGAGSKVAGTIDFAAFSCTPENAFDDSTCQKPVKDGKDGKTFLMQSITTSNISALVPVDDLKRVFKNFKDPTYSETGKMLIDLSAADDGFFPNLEGNGKAKAILQTHLESIGTGGLYGNFVWPFHTVRAPQAKMTAAGVSIRFNTLPTREEVAKMAKSHHFWALQIDMSEMAYPPGFSALPAYGKKDCRNTTTAWGHVGFQYTNGVKHANWGGGGNGNGTADYGCGGSDVSSVPFEVGIWYDYKVTRADRLGPKLWKWTGEIIEKSSGKPIYSKSMFGGEYVTYATTWIETPGGRACADPKVSTEWKEPWYGNHDAQNRLQIFRVGAVSLTFANDACLRSREDVISTCRAEWRQDMGAVRTLGTGGDLLPPPQANLVIPS